MALHHARALDTWHCGATARQNSLLALCDSCGRSKQVSTCAYSMALVPQTESKGDACGFWTHPGVAEAVQQLHAILHKGSKQVSTSSCHDETIVATIFLAG